jgi:hypothetical protein
MWDDNELRQTVAATIQDCWRKSQGDMNKTYELAKEHLALNRNFDPYDLDRLVAKARECGSTGGYLDMTDPYLLGGAKRPLDRS